jgi:hypothetical protein
LYFDLNFLKKPNPNLLVVVQVAAVEVCKIAREEARAIGHATSNNKLADMWTRIKEISGTHSMMRLHSSSLRKFGISATRKYEPNGQ